MCADRLKGEVCVEMLFFEGICVIINLYYHLGFLCKFEVHTSDLHKFFCEKSFCITKSYVNLQCHLKIT